MIDFQRGARSVSVLDSLTTSTMTKISCRALSHSYRSLSGETTPALDGLDLDVAEHQLLCVVGPSGCGKTTLLYLIAGLLRPTSGTITVSGKVVAGPGADRAVAFQRDAVFPWYTVAENIEYGPRINGVPKEIRRERVTHLLQLVGLTGQERRFPKELSGGMRKRVDLARAYANEPQVLLMDEPFGALDAIAKETMQTELLAIAEARPTTIVFVTHDLEEALFLGDRVILMTSRPGRISADWEVPFGRPRSAELRTSAEFQSLRGRLRGLFTAAEAEPV